MKQKKLCGWCKAESKERKTCQREIEYLLSGQTEWTWTSHWGIIWTKLVWAFSSPNSPKYDFSFFTIPRDTVCISAMPLCTSSVRYQAKGVVWGLKLNTFLSEHPCTCEVKDKTPGWFHLRRGSGGQHVALVSAVASQQQTCRFDLGPESFLWAVCVSWTLRKTN